MFASLLQLLIANAPSPGVAEQLQAIYDHCGKGAEGTVHTNTGGVPTDPPKPPKKPNG